MRCCIYIKWTQLVIDDSALSLFIYCSVIGWSIKSFFCIHIIWSLLNCRSTKATLFCIYKTLFPSVLFPFFLIQNTLNMSVRPTDSWNVCLNTSLEQEDKEVYEIVENEKLRQWSGLELIASEVRYCGGRLYTNINLFFFLELYLSSCHWG